MKETNNGSIIQYTGLSCLSRRSIIILFWGGDLINHECIIRNYVSIFRPMFTFKTLSNTHVIQINHHWINFILALINFYKIDSWLNWWGFWGCVGVLLYYFRLTNFFNYYSWLKLILRTILSIFFDILLHYQILRE